MLNTRQRMRTSSVGDGFSFSEFSANIMFWKKKKGGGENIERFSLFLPIFSWFLFPLLSFFSVCYWFNAGAQVPCIAIFGEEKKKKKGIWGRILPLRFGLCWSLDHQ